MKTEKYGGLLASLASHGKGGARGFANQPTFLIWLYRFLKFEVTMQSCPEEKRYVFMTFSFLHVQPD